MGVFAVLPPGGGGVLSVGPPAGGGVGFGPGVLDVWAGGGVDAGGGADCPPSGAGVAVLVSDGFGDGLPPPLPSGLGDGGVESGPLADEVAPPAGVPDSFAGGFGAPPPLGPPPAAPPPVLVAVALDPTKSSPALPSVVNDEFRPVSLLVSCAIFAPILPRAVATIPIVVPMNAAIDAPKVTGARAAAISAPLMIAASTIAMMSRTMPRNAPTMPPAISMCFAAASM